jgi:hypothetical protein
MRLGVHLKKIKEVIRDWWFFFTAACLLNYLIFAGAVYKKPDIDPELASYVEYFEDAANQYNVDLPMKNLFVSFVDSFPVQGWVGLCESGNGLSKYVSIHRAYFKKAPSEIKYALVIHELGHCVVGKPHVEGYLSDHCPKSVMHPSDGLFGCFFKHQDYYFKELFGLL